MTRTDPSKGEESLWHDVGTDMALKKAAKILSERSVEFRNVASRKRKAAPEPKDPVRLQADTDSRTMEGYGQDALKVDPIAMQPGQVALQPNLGVVQASPGQMMGYQASYSNVPPAGFPAMVGYQGGAEHLRHALLVPDSAAAGTPPFGPPGGDQQLLPQGELTEATLATVSAAAEAAAFGAAFANDSSATPGARERSQSAEGSNLSNPEAADDESPESIAQDASAVSDILPSAASLAGVFTSSSSEPRGKDSSPSTDESKDEA